MALRNQKRRRRRRSSSARAAARPIRIAGQRDFRLHTAELLASLGVMFVALMLIALVWINESRAITTENSEVRAHVEATLSSQALVLADEVRREILGVEQALRILKQSFEADPAHFDMKIWQQQLPALSDVTDDAFILDEQFIIRNDINPQSVGLGIGARIAGVLGPIAPRASNDDTMLIGPTVERPQSREHVSFLMIPLDHPGGWMVGAIYRTNLLSRMYSEASLGTAGMTALINTRLGRVQAVTGPAAANPDYDITKSVMYAAMRTRPDGTWTGASALDDVQRIHAFRSVPKRELAVVVAVNEAAAMQPAATWAEGARSLAWVATVIILVGLALTLRGVWTFRSTRRQREALYRERTIVASTQYDLADVRARLGARTAQLQTVLAGVDEGALVLDPDRRVMEWNSRFLMLFGVVPEQMQAGLALDEMLRAQALAGVFGPLEDVEAEVALRAAQLRAASGTVAVIYAGPAGSKLLVRATEMVDRSLVLLVGEATGQEQLSAPLRSASVEHAAPSPEPAPAVAPSPAPVVAPSPATGPVETL